MPAVTKSAIVFHNEISTKFLKNYHSKRFIERMNLFTEITRRKLKKGTSVLDVGCGPGIISLNISKQGFFVKGIDGSEKMIKIAKDQLNSINNVKCSFELGDIPDILEYEKTLYDGIICSSVLEYIDDMDKTLGLIAKLIKPYGYFIVSMPNPKSIYRRFERKIFKILGKPEYLKSSIHVLTLKDFEQKMKPFNYELCEVHFFARKNMFFTVLSFFLPKKYVNNMYLCVFKKADL